MKRNNIVFGFCIALFICGVFNAISWTTSPGPYSYLFNKYIIMNVSTTSMQDTRPQGSLIIIEPSDPKDLKIGDDITYILDYQKPPITHRIINVIHCYENAEYTAFRTKGTNNPEPDQSPVLETMVLGRVVFHVPILGDILTILPNIIFNPKNLLLIIVVISSIAVLALSIRGLLLSYK